MIGMGMETEIFPKNGSNGTIGRVKRPSGSNYLRVTAAANNVKAAAGATTVIAKATSATATGTVTVARSSSMARRAGEGARKALLRM
jgi:hypothetical protein